MEINRNSIICKMETVNGAITSIIPTKTGKVCFKNVGKPHHNMYYLFVLNIIQQKNVGIRETMVFLYAFRFVCVLATLFL